MRNLVLSPRVATDGGTAEISGTNVEDSFTWCDPKDGEYILVLTPAAKA